MGRSDHVRDRKQSCNPALVGGELALKTVRADSLHEFNGTARSQWRRTTLELATCRSSANEHGWPLLNCTS